MAFGLDLALLQGAVNHLYRVDPRFSVIDGEGFRLELVIPTFETRPDCGPTRPYRLGIHLLGNLFLDGLPGPLLFDAWVALDTAPGTDAQGMPIGTLRFGEVEDVTPDFARQPLIDQFGPDGDIGKVLAGFDLPVFEAMLGSATAIAAPPADPEAEVPPDPSLFAVDFWLGKPAPIRRPVYVIEDGEPVLDLDLAEMTVPALMATVSLAGTSPRMTGDPSVVRPGTGLQLVTTKAAFDTKLAIEAAATVDTEVQGLTIDALAMEGVDGGMHVAGAGHKTGASVTFEGVVIARYQGGTDGHLYMGPAVDVDVDLDTWVEVLSAIGILVFPLIGLFLVEVLVWGPEDAAPGKLNNALADRFVEPLTDVGKQLAEGFGVDEIPSAAFLSDLWIFDGNLGVAAAAFLGYAATDVRGVTYDVAHVGPKPGVRTNRRRPVKSVADITLGTGQTLTPWQAAALVRDGIVELPGHHAVHQPRAREEWYLRSNPNDTDDDNLIR
jgi:hypothetical protein